MQSEGDDGKNLEARIAERKELAKRSRISEKAQYVAKTLGKEYVEGKSVCVDQSGAEYHEIIGQMFTEGSLLIKHYLHEEKEFVVDISLVSGPSRECVFLEKQKAKMTGYSSTSLQNMTRCGDVSIEKFREESRWLPGLERLYSQAVAKENFHANASEQARVSGLKHDYGLSDPVHKLILS